MKPAEIRRMLEGFEARQCDREYRRRLKAASFVNWKRRRTTAALANPHCDNKACAPKVSSLSEELAWKNPGRRF
jgi:hypothetical protein